MPSKTKLVAALASVTPIVTASAVVSVDPRIAEFQEYGSMDARDATALAERTINVYAPALRGVDFQTWERIRVAYELGATNAGYSAAQSLFSRNVATPLGLMGIVKPKSATSSANRVLSPEAKAKAEAAEAANVALKGLTDAKLTAAIADASKPGKLDAVVLAKLYTEKARRAKDAKAATVKTERDVSATARKACIAQLDLMNAKGLEAALSKLVAIVKDFPKA
jgi:hypothetical protein